MGRIRLDALARWLQDVAHADVEDAGLAHELAAYGDAAAGRRVADRLRHPPPASAAEASRWTFPATERDLAGHINNAAYWQALEEELLLGAEDPEQLDAEMEYRTPSQPREKLVLREGERRWMSAQPARPTHPSSCAAEHDSWRVTKPALEPGPRSSPVTAS